MSRLRRFAAGALLIWAAVTLRASVSAYAETFPANWWNDAWRFRVPLTVSAGSFARVDKPAEKSVNFTTLLTTVGQTGATLDLNSLRVVEVDAQGAVIAEAVKFQFDPASGFNPTTNAAGNLIVLAEGTTASGASRYYHVYFDTTNNGPFTPLTVTPQVTVTNVANYEGQDSFKIQTPNATGYYHKQGAGFASMVDVQANDWISFHPGAGTKSAGEFRGIPNLGVWAHPGYTNASSALTSSGPLKAIITSTSTDGLRSLKWEIYPGYATMTLLSKPSGENYWFLYEGTPYGALDPNRDYYVLSNGQKTYVPATEQVTLLTDIASPEWLYFGDDPTNRVLFMAHHEDDTQPDYFRQQDDAPPGDGMTVFGFGRQDPCCTRYLSQVPAHLTIGFGDTASVTQTINSAYQTLSVNLGQAVALNHAPVLAPIGNKTIEAEQTLTFNVSATDQESTTPILSADPLPPGATFTDNGNGTGQFSWTPASAGADPVTFVASDGVLSDSETITITVTAIPVTGDSNKLYLPLVLK